MTALYFVIGLAAILAAIAAFIGWLVPLIIGVVKLRRGTGGQALTLIGAIWAAGALGLVVVVALVARSISRAVRVEEFNPTAYSGEMGTIVIPYPGDASLVLWQAGGKRIRVHAKGGAAQAPAGKFHVASFQARARDRNGAQWIAMWSIAPSDEWPPVSVRPDAPLHLDLGPPFAAVVEAAGYGQNQRDRVLFDLKITGRDGHAYTIRPAGLGAARGNQPRFEVRDQSGRVVWQGNFECGSGGTCRYCGRIPPNVKGNLTIRPVLPNCPFEVRARDTAWSR